MDKTLIFLFAAFVICSAQYHKVRRSCAANLAHMPNFDQSKFDRGIWYEHRRIQYNNYYLKKVHCVSASHTSGSDNVVVKGKLYTPFTTDASLSCGASCTMNIAAPYFNFELSGSFYVVDTDYDNYAVLFGCNPRRAGRSSIFGHLLFRRYSVINDDDITDQINKLKEYTNGEDLLKDTTTSDCDWP